jgi:hypothetical protein
MNGGIPVLYTHVLFIQKLVVPQFKKAPVM